MAVPQPRLPLEDFVAAKLVALGVDPWRAIPLVGDPGGYVRWAISRIASSAEMNSSDVLGYARRPVQREARRVVEELLSQGASRSTVVGEVRKQFNATREVARGWVWGYASAPRR